MTIDRRLFLTLPLALALAPLRAAAEGVEERQGTYTVDVGILHETLRFQLGGTIHERVDRPRGRYEVRIAGQGTGLANRSESSGVLRGGRWLPRHSSSWVSVAGREGRADVDYDYERGTISYRSRSETFFLRRVRTVDDLLPMPPGLPVDDTVSAVLNLGEGPWPPPARVLDMHVVRRQRSEKEDPEEGSRTFRAEIATTRVELDIDPASGKARARFDLRRFSTWALRDQPAHAIFGADRRPELITARLMYGTSFAIRFAA